MDLSVRCYRTFDDLYQYCYRVASVVGLCSLYMMGFRDPEAKRLAERCGIAFQLTNILRDVREDAQTGRVYLPQEDLERFGYAPELLAAPVQNAAFRELMQFEIARARTYYTDATRLIGMVEAESRPALWTLIAIYRRLLGAVERRVNANGDPRKSEHGGAAAGPATLSAAEKLSLVARAALKRLQLQTGGQPDWRLDA
jgi:phytoene synthase